MSESRIPAGLIAAMLAAIIALFLLFLVRPIGLIHGTAMMFYLAPMFTYGLIGVIVFVALGLFFSDNSTVAGIAVIGTVFFAIFGLWGMFTQHAFNQRALYRHSHYETIKQLPMGGKVRVMPRAVAHTIALNSFNSSTETLTGDHIIRDEKGDLVWTYEQAPTSGMRTLTRNTEGGVTLNASESESDIHTIDKQFKVGPSMKYADGISWRVYKKHYLSDVQEIIAIPNGKDAKGKPTMVFAASYVKYRGFLTKRPYFAGVMVFYPDGHSKDFTPEQAAKDPLLKQAGHVYPTELARRVQDAYAYNKGILNIMFYHKNQTEINDPDKDNSQPYLMAFKDGSLQLVSVAEPHGRAYAADAVFLTDAITGHTQLWHVPKDTNYSGPEKALDAAAGRAYPGVVFGSGRGKFRAIEPRPVFFDGKLYYLISIVPDRKTSVAKSVIVDAHENKVVAVFDHDADPTATKTLITALEEGKLPDLSDDDTDPGSSDPNASPVEQLQALIDENNKSLAEDQKRSVRMQKLLDQIKENQATGSAKNEDQPTTDTTGTADPATLAAH